VLVEAVLLAQTARPIPWTAPLETNREEHGRDVRANTIPAIERHLAQLNVALAKGPMDGPVMADFQAALEPINALADAARGFVWRLQTEDGDATAIRPYEDERMMVNMSVWESIEALRAFVYTSAHTPVMRERRRWFEQVETYLVLWWVPAGHEPTIEEAKERLEHLKRHGPTPYAFTFRASFAAADAEPGAALIDDEIGCPA
jgi:heme-degrading monooxygenase HmoA